MIRLNVPGGVDVSGGTPFCQVSISLLIFWYAMRVGVMERVGAGVPTCCDANFSQLGPGFIINVIDCAKGTGQGLARN